MSIFDQIKKTTRYGLERLGVTLPLTDIPDDDDTRSRDILDIYSDILERSNKQTYTATPVPAALCQEMKSIAEPLCADNQTLLSTISSWLEDRSSVLGDLEDTRPLTKESAVQELYTILVQIKVLQKISDDPDEWLKTAQSIAQTQQRNMQNLLLQASHQFEADSFDAWMAQMNERIGRFGIKVVKINEKMGIVSC